jgi:competence protein ComEC
LVTALAWCVGAGLCWSAEWLLAVGALWLLLRGRHATWLVAVALASHGIAAGREPKDAPRPWRGLARARGESRPRGDGSITFAELLVADGGASSSDLFAFVSTPGGRPWSEGEWRRVEGTWSDGGKGRNPGSPRPPAQLVATAADSISADPTRGLSLWLQLRRHVDRVGDAIDRRLQLTLSPRAAALARSLAMGRSDRLDEEFRARLRRCGAWHLFAVSGSHVMLLAALLARLLPPRPERLRRSVTALLVLGFALLCGGQAPAWRAAIGHTLHSIATFRLRRPCAATLLSATFLLLVTPRPGLLFDAGTGLSFAAVFALLVAARHGPSRSPRGSGRGLRVWRPALGAIRCALFAAIATAPLTALHFGTISWWAPVSTLLLTLPVTAALSLSLAAILLAPMPALISWPLDRLLRWLDDLLASAASWLAALPSPPQGVAVPAPTTLGCLAASWIALYARRPGLALFCALAATAAGLRPIVRIDAPAIALDVGHGQALLLRSGNRTDLIDAGGRPPDGPRRVAAALDALGVGRLDSMVLSHLDADHCAAAPELLAQVEIGEVVISADAAEELASASSAITTALREALLAARVPVRIVAAGDSVGPHRLLWPPAGRRFGERNDGSIVLRASLPTGSLLVPGDLTGFPLIELAQSLGDQPPIDALVLPHHGNVDPALSALLTRLRAKRAFASRVGTRLPSATGEALASCGVVWWSTASQGALRFDPGGATCVGTATCESGR